MIEIVRGDLLKVRRGVIVHGVNCAGVMGAGIASQIKAKWPRVFNRYRAAIIGVRGEVGRVTAEGARLLGTIDVVNMHNDLYVVNAFTQVEPGPHASYDAIAECFGRLSVRSDLLHLPLCFPLIGCGIGGLKWPIVKSVIEESCPWPSPMHLYILR